MTGNLERLMAVRQASVHKDANVQAAEDIGKRAELGYFDVEFTMYGCAYLQRDNDMMQYRISSKADDITSFIEKAPQRDIYPSRMETVTFTCPVPAGAKALIAQDVKLALAKRLREQYPKAFFRQLYQMADDIDNDAAAPLLWEEVDAIAGCFEEEALSRFEALLHYAYTSKRLSRASYAALLAWLADERRSMGDDLLSKDIFEKTLYGVVYSENGQLRYVSNAQRAYVFQKAYGLEARGLLVSPLYAKTYWYNYDYRLPAVTQDFKEALKRDYDQAFFAKLTRLKGQSGPQQAWASQLKHTAERCGPGPSQTLRRCGCRWGVL